MTIAEPKERKAFLDAHPEIQFFEIVFTNMAGVPRGKRLRRHEIMAVFEQGRFLPGSILVNDITGQDVEATGLVWEDGDADRVAKPIAGRLTPAPWLGADVAQVALSMYELDGKPNDLDPRHVLQRVIDRFTADGLVPVVACELEYYLVDARRTRTGGIQLPRSPLTGDRPTQHQVYGLREVEEASGFLRDLWAAADALGVPLEGAISEYAPGQLELTLKHHADALRAADDAVLYKRAAKGVALRHGCEATFMAKPFADMAGSGMHLHVSVNDTKGKNIMASEAPEGAPEREARHRRHEGAAGGFDGDLCAQRQFLPPLQGQFLRSGRAHLGRQQPHRFVPRARRRAAHAPYRAPRRRRRRASGAGARGAACCGAPWVEPASSIPAPPSSATATPRRRRAGRKSRSIGSRRWTASPSPSCSRTIWASASCACIRS